MAVKSPTGTAVRTLLFFLLASLIVLLVYSVLKTMIENTAIPALQIRTGLFRGLKLFIEHLIPIQVSALLLAYSVFFNPQAYAASQAGAGARRSFHGFVSSTVVLIIVLTSMYTFLYTASLPLIQRRIQELEYLSRSARAFLAEAMKAEEQKELDQAYFFYNLYLSIDPDDREVLKQRAEIVEERATGERQAMSTDKPAEQPVPEVARGSTTDELLSKAGAYMNIEDYFSAHYYASLVLALDPANREAENIRIKAWEQLTGYLPSRSDTEATKLFDAKLKGLAALEEGRPIEAYYLFKGLSETHRRDADVIEFLEESKKRMSKISFFEDEVRSTPALPGILGITFINRGTGSGQTQMRTQLIHLGRTVNTPTGLYFHGIEILDFSRDGRLLLHLRAPYGKLIEERINRQSFINMQCLHRSDQNKTYLPDYEVGGPGEKGHVVVLNQQVQHLPYYDPDRKSIYRMGISELWNIRESYGRAGYDRREIEMEFLMRILNPFLYLILSLLAVSMGWAYRARYLGRPPVLTYLFIPVVPFLVSQVVELFVHAHRILLGFVFVTLSFTIALALLIALQAAFLAISLLVLAGQITD
jgi:tetratricopeptide (TPR) repeat protein